MMDGVPKYKFLFEAVSNLMKAYQVGDKPSPYQTDNVDFQGLIQQERDLYIPEAQFLKMVFQKGFKNRSLKALCQSYCHYTWSDPDSFATLLEVMIQGLNDSDYADAKPFFVLAQFLLQKPGGEKQEKRFDRTILSLIDVLEKNRIYYKFMEAAFEFLFKLAGNVPHVAIWFQGNKDKWELLREWCQKVSFPVNSMDNIRLYKKKNNFNQYPQYLKQEAYKNKFLQQARLARI